MVNELAPCFLVAAPRLACPHFNHTVVLLVDHREEGSLGFVINKLSDLHFPEVLAQVGVATARPGVAETPVLVGGPVSPETGWVVFDPRDGQAPEDGVVQVAKCVSVSANVQMLEHIARGDGPRRRLMILGYAGWGPGQLDREIQEGSWLPVDLDAGLVFDIPCGDRWAAAYGALGVDPARFVGSVVADA